MATKTPKKKTVKSASKQGSANKTAKAAPMTQQQCSAQSTVVPFSPVAAEALRSISGNAPEMKTYYNAMEKTMSNYKDQYEKMSGDASAVVRQGIEGYVRFGTSMMKGCEAIMKTCIEMAQDSAERNSAALKSLMACRTLNEAAEAQNKLAQTNMDDAMSAVTKISEMTIKVCTEACEPLNDQMTKAMKKMSA